MYIQTFMYWTLAAILQAYTRPDINNVTGGDRVVPETIARLVARFNNYAHRYLSVYRPWTDGKDNDAVPNLVQAMSKHMRFGTLKDLPSDEEADMKLLLDKMYKANFDMVTRGSAINVFTGSNSLYRATPAELSMGSYGVVSPLATDPYLGAFSDADKERVTEYCKIFDIHGLSFTPSEVRLRRISLFDALGEPALYEGDDPMRSKYPVKLIVYAADDFSPKSWADEYLLARKDVVQTKHTLKVSSTKMMDIKF